MARKRALVTGGAKRIGRAIALELSRQGYDVAIHYRSSEKEASALARAIKDNGGKTVTVKADLRDAQEAERIVAEAAAKLGGPFAVLVNNAASFERDTLESFTGETWTANIHTNVLAPLVLCRAFVEGLPKGRRGAIVNLIDQRVLGVTTDFLTYTLSKHALLALTRLLARELAPRISVNAIGPGPTLQSVYQSKAQFEREVKSLPLQEGPRPEDIADGVRFLLESPALTGQMIAMDGGQHMTL